MQIRVPNLFSLDSRRSIILVYQYSFRKSSLFLPHHLTHLCGDHSMTEVSSVTSIRFLMNAVSDTAFENMLRDAGLL